MTGLCAGLWFTNRGRRVFFWVGGSGLWNIDLEPRIVWFLFLVQPSFLVVLISKKTADYKSEEGGDEVKSSCPLYPGLHTCYNGPYKELRYREVELISKNGSKSGLKAEIRLHEVGVASNRRSATLR